MDALASQPHYADHLRPVWNALPERGRFHVGHSSLGKGDPTLVASFVDARHAVWRPVAYMEHGVGQTYAAGHPSYAGGKGKDHVGLFLEVNERTEARNRAAYPAAEHAVVGCPMLDRWLGHKPDNAEPIVAFAWHWNGLGVAPEARWAFPHYADALEHLPYQLLGHGHPRAMRRLRWHYDRMGITWTDSFAEVMQRADVLVFDNTSAGFLFAATGRPVVVLDAPWYRKAWGGRFWEWADVGVRIAQPQALKRAIGEALEDDRPARERRAQITGEIFGELDGRATERAVNALTGWLSRLPEKALVAA